MPVRKETRGRLVETAARLLQEQGYHATGLNQVLREGKAPRGSLYFHFPGGKEELAAEAVDHLGARLGAELEQVLDAHRSLAAGLRAVLGLFARRLQKSGYVRGCPIATAALEASGGPEAVRRACSEAFRGWEDKLAGRLRAEGQPEARARATALSLLALVEGALLLAKAHQSVEPLERAADAAELLLA